MQIENNKNKLALFGGPKTIDRPFKKYNTIGAEEKLAAQRVLDSGNLSQFLGAWHDDFFGGPEVLSFERQCASYFKVKHAITVNSWTSGLIAAVGALGLEPGDEVIVPPWTMCASATSILIWNCIPVFADIDPKTFCIDPESVKKNITDRTRAILAVDIFGQSADLKSLRSIANQYGLKIISDTAQSPGAKAGDDFAGTMADIGGYSLNYHKHIHSGEGGILVTNDDDLATRLKLIRNHAEAVVGGMGYTSLINMVGFNFRLGEIESAIAAEQLKKLSSAIVSRQTAAERLKRGLEGLHGLRLPYIAEGNTHVYYIFPMTLDLAVVGVSRARIVDALRAEGVTVSSGYQNIHLLPMYQTKTAYGSKGHPWSAPFARQDVTYQKGICPVAEELHDSTFISIGTCTFEYSDPEVDLVVTAFQKVWANLNELKV